MLDVNSLLVPGLWDLQDRFKSKGFDIKLVGGCVRDLLAGITPEDVDLHTDADPLECKAIYQEAGVKFIDTGLGHGTWTVVFDHVPYEITSLREDVRTDGRHAQVSYTRDWLTDARRRDFTINSMSMTFEGQLFDPFGGADDLANGRVRFVGDANQRIQEDYLRILRWFRFRGRFEKTEHQFDEIAAAAVINNSDGLRLISRERVWSELSKILVGPHALYLMESLRAMGVSRILELRGVWIHHKDPYLVHVHAHTRNPVTMMVALYKKWAPRILKSFKTSNQEHDLACWLTTCVDKKISPSRHMAVNGISSEWARELGVLRGMDAFDLAVLEGWVPPQFPVNGYDLIRLGIKPGPHYGEIIQRLKNSWADSDYTLTQEQLLKQVALD